MKTPVSKKENFETSEDNLPAVPLKLRYKKPPPLGLQQALCIHAAITGRVYGLQGFLPSGSGDTGTVRLPRSWLAPTATSLQRGLCRGTLPHRPCPKFYRVSVGLSTVNLQNGANFSTGIVFSLFIGCDADHRLSNTSATKISPMQPSWWRVRRSLKSTLPQRSTSTMQPTLEVG